MSRFRIRISLANKCQIMFGAALVLILVTSLSVPWLRMQKLVEEGQRQIARSIADAWLRDMIQLGGPMQSAGQPPQDRQERKDRQDRPLRLRLIDEALLQIEADADPFVATALEQFENWENQEDYYRITEDRDGRRVYRYARAIRHSDLEPSRGGFASDLPPTQVADPLRAILLIEMRADWAADQVRLNRVYLVAAGLFAGVLAIAVFWFITHHVILSPVRVLRDTTEKVADGDLNIRSDLNTGDEFEQLSDAFNTMLGNLKNSQDKLHNMNKQLDLKLGELAQSNLSLYEANRIKGDFLANVSHELRTPLNSIIGFAEVLHESTEGAETRAEERRRRYAENILTSSRSLLQMINELLDLAKIEAGRMELHADRMAVADICETLLNLIRPQADRKDIALELSLHRRLPMVTTDPGKFQQIVFNFLSNAVKFTPQRGRVELGARPAIDEKTGETVGVRVWVTDTGPGIPIDRHEEVFDKFRQIDSSHTRQHGGTGLGLAISLELARLLGGRIELDSDVGRGATFSLTIPLTLAETTEPLMPDADATA